MTGDQAALINSSAGLRLIAQLALLNRGDFKRLRAFIAESYTPAALEVEILPARLAALRGQYASGGPLRIYQVIAADKHRVIALTQARRSGALFYTELAVEADYPHRIADFVHRPLPPEEQQADA